MKRTFICLLATILTLLSGVASAQTRTLGDIRHGEGTNFYKVDAVTVCDTATIVDLVALHLIHYWTQLDSDPIPVIIADNGQSYAFRGIEGYQFDKHMVTPLKGYLPFRMWFEPLPASVKSFSIKMDSTSENIYNIPVVAEAQSPDYMDNVPEKVVRNSTPALNRWYEPNPTDTGDAEVTIHIMGNLPSLNTPTIYYSYNSHNLGGSNQHITIPLKEQFNGTGTVKFTVPVHMGATVVSLMLDENWKRPISMLVLPGHNEFWWDLARWSRATSRWKPTDESFLFGDNKMAAQTTVMNKLHVAKLGLRIHNIYKPLANKTLTDIEDTPYEQLSRMIMDEFEQYATAIEKNATLSPIEKRVYTLNALNECLLMSTWSVTMSRPYKYVDEQVLKGVYDFNAWKNMPEKYKKEINALDAPDAEAILIPIVKEVCGRALKYIDRNSLAQLYFLDNYHLLNIEELSNGAFDKYPKHIINRVMRTRNAISFNYPYRKYTFQSAIEFEQVLKVRAKQKLKEMGQIPLIHDMSTVAPKNVFKSILDSYKGSVVVVDLWATWCGSCRESMRAMENSNVKKEFGQKGVKFVYICLKGELSAFESFAPQISGEHYFLDKEQSEVLIKQVGLKAFPTYLLVDKDGNWSICKEVRNTATAPEILNKALAQ